MDIVTGRLSLDGFSHVAHVGSLPLLLRVAEAAPRGEPWLTADSERTATWRRRRPAAQRTVGLCWEGRASHPQDARRSLPLHLLQRLVLPGTLLTGLQRPPLRAVPPESFLAMDWGPDVMDFAEAAAMLTALDALVTVDTAMAHLAGALGRPAVVLLPWVPDWRWGLSGERTPWYPSLRLARQPRPGDWLGAWAQVGALLETIIPAG
ncbi:glycosyltransferase family 9 protein [Sediminicoccus sp. KRV36]|uniref:glycosyltransferase family 9 protein n=1 Tax=Sediminicoccus sp. KRV36 TaxID=3133721 RepID=UPI00200D6017|nr:glycosyltransferase family 9 protein [Sediminicoccus rosea]UPY37230.1 hypothetical protein LHU95_00635 [Sediminicoccus rosea]